MPETTDSPRRRPTFPLSHAARRKPRRWPLALRFAKGSIHSTIIAPVAFHGLFAALVVLAASHGLDPGLPSSVVPSLSIVVGLMLVFRNTTSYERFWTGRNHFNTITTAVRNLTRFFLIYCSAPDGKPASDAERADTERTVRILLAILVAVKNHLRAEWSPAQQSAVPAAGIDGGLESSSSNTNSNSSNSNTPGTQHADDLATSTVTLRPEYVGLLPGQLKGLHDRGLGLPLQLSLMVEQYVRRGLERNWFNAPQSSLLSGQLNALMEAYGKMETIRTTPIPVAHLIHQKQVLALYSCVLPFATVAEMAWWTIPIVVLVSFTLYGIEGISVQLEDPYGYDKNDIKMDGIVDDARQEILVLLEEWQDKV